MATIEQGEITLMNVVYIADSDQQWGSPAYNQLFHQKINLASDEVVGSVVVNVKPLKRVLKR